LFHLCLGIPGSSFCQVVCTFLPCVLHSPPFSSTLQFMIHNSFSCLHCCKIHSCLEWS
jgi:hypothetical protein